MPYWRLVIGVCYRSPNLGIVRQGNSSCSKLRAVLQEVADKDVLIMGDFNYPDVDWKTGTAYHFADTHEFVQTIGDCFYGVQSKWRQTKTVTNQNGDMPTRS